MAIAEATTIEDLTDEQLSTVLDGWAPVPPAGCGLTRRDMLLKAINNRLTTGQLTVDQVLAVAA